MTLPSTNQLEEIYSKLLKIVAKEVNAIEELEDIDTSTAKKVELYDKVLRASLEYFSKKPIENDLADFSDEDLLRELENDTGNKK
jgi:hypothetical protein